MNLSALNIQDLLAVEELMSLLGYTDYRSVFGWCKKYKIPVLKLGLKKYVKAGEISELIDNQLLNFEKRNQIPDKKQTKTNQTFHTQNEIIAKYLNKYEKQDWSKTSKKR